MIGMKPTMMLPVTAAITAGQSRAEFIAVAVAEPLVGVAVDLS